MTQIILINLENVFTEARILRKGEKKHHMQ